MNSYPVMTSLSEVVALKRVDMENTERQKRNYFAPITPRVTPWNQNNERTSSYFPNINRSYITDLTYLPGTLFQKKFHKNSLNRMSSWSPYVSQIEENLEPLLEGEDDEDLERLPSLTDPLQHPTLTITKPLRLLSREYKHPLSMYEESLSNIYSRYAHDLYATRKYSPLFQDPITPRQYHFQPEQTDYSYLERPPCAGKQWVMNRWRMWSGGSSTSPA